jgi:hypothetical protein
MVMTLASAMPIRRKHTPDGGIAASHEATDMLYQAMCLAPYLLGGMVVSIAINSVIFYYILAVELNY